MLNQYKKITHSLQEVDKINQIQQQIHLQSICQLIRRRTSIHNFRGQFSMEIDHSISLVHRTLLMKNTHHLRLITHMYPVKHM